MDLNKYIIDTTNYVSNSKSVEKNPSIQLRKALINENPEIKYKKFWSNVSDSIFMDAIDGEFGDNKYIERLLFRLNRRYGKRTAKKIIIKHSEILHAWKYELYHFVPDAYLIDKENRIVVCYEVEDFNSLSPAKICDYGEAWFILDYIYWNLILISYDIYGNHRVILLPFSMFIANRVYELRNRPQNKTDNKNQINLPVEKFF